MSRIRSHLTYANVMATLAVFIALGGGAYAVTIAKKNSVVSKSIKNGQVKKKDLAKNAVISTKVKNGSLLSQDFAAGQLPRGATGPQGPIGATGARGATGPSTGLAGGDLTGTYPNPTIASGAVNSAKIADGGVRGPDLGAITVRTGSVGVPTGGSEFATADCAPGEQVIGAGTSWATNGADRYTSYVQIVGKGVQGRGSQSTGTNQTFIVDAYCLAGP